MLPSDPYNNTLFGALQGKGYKGVVVVIVVVVVVVVVVRQNKFFHR